MEVIKQEEIKNDRTGGMVRLLKEDNGKYRVEILNINTKFKTGDMMPIESANFDFAEKIYEKLINIYNKKGHE